MDEKQPETNNFALSAAIFEGGLAVAAVAIGRLLGVAPLESLHANWSGLGLGLLAILPPLGLLFFCVKCPWRPLADLVGMVDTQIAPLFAGLSTAQLAIICLLAGVGEELLFRGLLQTAIAGWIGGTLGVWVGLALVGILFAASHALSWTYFVLAGLIGLYLGLIWMATGNLLVPVTAHAGYDLLALLYLLGRTREGKG